MELQGFLNSMVVSKQKMYAWLEWDLLSILILFFFRHIKIFHQNVLNILRNWRKVTSWPD